MMRRSWLRSSSPVRVEPRRLRLTLTAFCSLLFILLFFFDTYNKHFAALSALPHRGPDPSRIAPSRRARLHLLVPATSSNEDLCKLLLSAEILGYPAPVLVNYGAFEQEDPYDQHLAKVETLLAYLRILQADPKRENDNDLVLIVDGYDLWFQLRPDVLLKRYHAVNDAFQESAVKLYGEKVVNAHGIRQSILFGPDKLCWPIDFDRPACWAVPAAPLQQHAFGPKTHAGPFEAELSMPQWLNSGTIIGPIDDLVDLLSATLHRIRTRFTQKSDQLYFADLWGEQEFARLRLRGADALEAVRAIPHAGEAAEVKHLDPIPTERTEYHVGLDYASALFQTVAFYEGFLVWKQSRRAVSPGATAEQSQDIPADLAASPGPFAATNNRRMFRRPRLQPGWADADLCHNNATEQIPVTIHFTGDKTLRSQWWDRMWYQRDAAVLRQAGLALRDSQAPLAAETIDGKWWFGASGANGTSDVDRGQARSMRKGGAWSDKGQWLSWDGLCHVHEPILFAKSEAPP